jgi:hypothetical protein
MNSHVLTNHSFNLSGMKVGDKFLGCVVCNLQLPVGAAARRCECKRPFSIFTVTAEDVRGLHESRLPPTI